MIRVSNNLRRHDIRQILPSILDLCGQGEQKTSYYLLYLILISLWLMRTPVEETLCSSSLAWDVRRVRLECSWRMLTATSLKQDLQASPWQPEAMHSMESIVVKSEISKSLWWCCTWYRVRLSAWNHRSQTPNLQGKSFITILPEYISSPPCHSSNPSCIASQLVVSSQAVWSRALQQELVMTRPISDAGKLSC